MFDMIRKTVILIINNYEIKTEGSTWESYITNSGWSGINIEQNANELSLQFNNYHEFTGVSQYNSQESL